MGLVLSDLTDEQSKELDLKTGGVLIEDVVGVVRGNVQPGDVILAIIQQGRADRGEDRRAGERHPREARQGRVGHVAGTSRRQFVLYDTEAQQRGVTMSAAREADTQLLARTAGARRPRSGRGSG